MQNGGAVVFPYLVELSPGNIKTKHVCSTFINLIKEFVFHLWTAIGRSISDRVIAIVLFFEVA